VVGGQVRDQQKRLALPLLIVSPFISIRGILAASWLLVAPRTSLSAAGA
jgi:hypothetical protein